MRKKLLVILALMLFIGSATAFDPDTFVRGSGVEAISSLTAVWDDTCAKFSWAGTGDTDFSTYVVQTTSSISKFNGLDFNTTSAETAFCTVGSGESITASVYRVDSNGSGLFLNVEPDASHKFTAGTLAQAGLFLFYNLIATVAGLVGLLVLIVVLTLLLAKMGMLKFLTFKK